MVNVSQEELEEFLKKAELNTWVAKKNKVAQPSIPGTKQYLYQDGNLLYVDIFGVKEDGKEFYGSEYVSYLDPQMQTPKLLMVRRYDGRVVGNAADLFDIDVLNNHLRYFRKRWLEESRWDLRREKAFLQEPIDLPNIVYRRTPSTNVNGPYIEETLEIASAAVLRHEFRTLMMAQLAP